jgi:hypothetical protein
MFTYNEIEQNLFEIDEELGHEKCSMRAKRALSASLPADHRQKRGNHNHTHCSMHTYPNTKFGNGKPSACCPPPRSNTLIAHAANGTDIVCFNCGEPGHIAPKFPKDKQKGPPVRSAACGNAALSTANQGTN